ncbi:MAG TPA: DegT/DnrJ/EryC1/StrS family aminotransferase, partial [Bdellovibrionota bacterium]|nr:DegT/DnrJ/EryC1/StrS family aminotransferase [Bdellovibrionota bacterium]
MTIPIKVPFMDLKRIHGPLKEEILARISSIIDRSAFVLGSEVEGFEKEFAGYVDTKHAIGVANGLDALKLALQAQGVGPGDEVITAANTFAATAFAISSVGARPVLADVEERTSNIDPSAVEKALSLRTKAILPVHLYGQPAELDALRAIAGRHGVTVLDDAAQAHGAAVRGRRVGGSGLSDVTAWSFYPGKNLGALGDGGAVTTDDDRIADRVRVLRNYGSRVKYVNEVQGVNSRLDEVQAAVLGAKLVRLDEWNARRTRQAERYAEQLADTRLVLPHVPEWAESAWHLYVVRC